MGLVGKRLMSTGYRQLLYSYQKSKRFFFPKDGLLKPISIVKIQPDPWRIFFFHLFGSYMPPPNAMEMRIFPRYLRIINLDRYLDWTIWEVVLPIRARLIYSILAVHTKRFDLCQLHLQTLGGAIAGATNCQSTCPSHGETLRFSFKRYHIGPIPKVYKDEKAYPKTSPNTYIFYPGRCCPSWLRQRNRSLMSSICWIDSL